MRDRCLTKHTKRVAHTRFVFKVALPTPVDADDDFDGSFRSSIPRKEAHSRHRPNRRSARAWKRADNETWNLYRCLSAKVFSSGHPRPTSTAYANSLLRRSLRECARPLKGERRTVPGGRARRLTRFAEDFRTTPRRPIGNTIYLFLVDYVIVFCLLCIAYCRTVYCASTSSSFTS